jgi:ribosomal protein L29
MERKTHVYSDGSKYEGAWKDGKRHGNGTWTRPDGLKYDGEWTDDKPNGLGTLTYPDGKKRMGEWKNGKFVKEKHLSESPKKTIAELEEENLALKKELSVLKQQLAQSNQLNKQDDQISTQAEQQKPKRSNKTRNILIGIGVIIILFFVFALLNQGDDDTLSADRSAEGVTEDQETMDQPQENIEATDDEDMPPMQFISMGEITTFADWEYSVIDVEWESATLTAL